MEEGRREWRKEERGGESVRRRNKNRDALCVQEEESNIFKENNLLDIFLFLVSTAPNATPPGALPLPPPPPRGRTAASPFQAARHAPAVTLLPLPHHPVTTEP